MTAAPPNPQVLPQRPATSPLIQPWSNPSGPLGRLAGWEMGRGKAAINEVLTELLPVRRHASVLEVGFGPGASLEHLLSRYPEARLAGVDPSELMLFQAAKRNRLAVLEGRCDLRLAAAERLPFPDDSFTTAFTLNTVPFWTSQQEGFSELARVLEQRGFLVIGLRARTGEPVGDGSGMAELIERLHSAGFEATAEQRRVGRQTMTFVGAHLRGSTGPSPTTR